MRIVLAFTESFNRHDVAAMMQLVSEDCTFEDAVPAPNGAVYAGKEAVTRFLQDFFRGSPDAHLEVEEIFGLGERCVMRWSSTSLDERGEKVHVRGVDLFKVRNQAIHEMLSYTKG